MTNDLCNLETLLTRGEIGQIESEVCRVVGYIVSQGGTIVLANAAAERLIGCTGIVGSRLRDIVGDYASPYHDVWVSAWIAEGRPQREMGDRKGPVRDYTVTISGTVWREKPAELAVILPSSPRTSTEESTDV